MRFPITFRKSDVWRSPTTSFLLFSALLIVVGNAVRGEENPPANSGSTGRISGSVIKDENNELVPGADVTLLLPPPPGQDVYIWPLPLRQATADAKGQFAFENLSPGKYRVWANHEKLTSRRETLRGERVEIPETGDPPKPLELRMRPGVALTARVKSQATGQPISKAIVHFGWSDLKDDNFTTDADGRVTLQPLTPQRWFIEARAEGFARAPQWINLESGADAEIEFLLGPGGDVSGVVRDPAGEAVADVGLSVRSPEDSQQLMYVKTDAQGHYRLENLPLGESLEVNLSKLEYLRETVKVTADGAKKAQDLTIRPRPHGGSITGSIVDQEGRAIADAELSNMGRSSNEVRSSKTDKQGRFLLENLYAGLYGHEVTVRAKTFAPLRVKVTPGPADKPAAIDIALNPGHTLKGRVEDEMGQPLEDVAVYFNGGNVPFSDGGRTKTDKLGRFDFDSLPEKCPFTFRKNGYSEINDLRPELDQPDVVTVKMSPTGAIQGVVLDGKTNQPVRSFNVRITFSQSRQPNDPFAGLASDLVNPGQKFQPADGKFQIKDLMLGMPLQVMVDAEGYEREVWERVVTTRLDKGEPVEFALTPIDPASRTTYSGRLRDANGKPVAGAVLRLIAGRERKPGRRTQFPYNWQMIRTGQISQQSEVLCFLLGKTTAEGRFEFPRIPKDAEVELVWWGDAIASGREDHLELLDEKDREAIEINLPAPGTIKAKIDRETFPRIGQVTIRSLDGMNEDHHVNLKADQTEVEVNNLAPGRYAVQVMGVPEPVPGRPGALTQKSLASATVDVDEGETSTVKFGGN